MPAPVAESTAAMTNKKIRERKMIRSLQRAAIALFLSTAAAAAGAQAPAPAAAAPANTVTVRGDQPGPTYDRAMFTQFAEHLGHGIYGGLWVGPDSKIPNSRGFRNDVVAAL